jgi:hypothetical protein
VITVVTHLWNDPDRDRDYVFTPGHVRIMRNMVKRNLTLPHRFVCITDETPCIELEDIETYPLNWDYHVPGSCFIRLDMRTPKFAERIGATRILSLDLDLVIVGNIDGIVDRTERMIFLRNPNFPKPKRAFYQGSIQLFDAGAGRELAEDFVKDEKWIAENVNWRFGGAEQAWISERLGWDQPHWTYHDGIYGAGWMAEQWGVPNSLPANARMVVFPGRRMPDQPHTRMEYPWIEEHYR